VLDAIRVGAKKMGDYLEENKLHECIEKYSLYTIDLS